MHIQVMQVKYTDSKCLYKVQRMRANRIHVSHQAHGPIPSTTSLFCHMYINVGWWWGGWWCSSGGCFAPLPVYPLLLW